MTKPTVTDLAKAYRPKEGEVYVVSDANAEPIEKEVPFLRGSYNGQHADPNTGYIITMYSFDVNAEGTLQSNGSAMKKDRLTQMIEKAAAELGRSVAVR